MSCRRTWMLAMLLLMVGCQQAPVSHVVVCWLKEPGNAAARQELIDGSRSLAKIPGIVSVSAGQPIPSTRPVVDSSFDVAIVMKFKDEKSLTAYEKHPVHLQAVERTLKPLVAKYVIYDFRE